MHEIDSGLAELAAGLAPQIDRLFIAGHREAAPRARTLRDELGLPNFGVLVDLRKLLLAPAGMTMRQAVAMERYSDRSTIETSLEAHMTQGLLACRDGVFVPTEQGKEVLFGLTDVLSQAAEALWGYSDSVETAADLSFRAVQHAGAQLGADRYPAFTAERNGYMSESPEPAFALWSNIATLRYLRADAHALAWQNEGLDSKGIAYLSALCTSGAPGKGAELPKGASADDANVREALRDLLRRGWSTRREGGWTATEAGRQARLRIESRTNQLNCPAFVGLSRRERGTLLAILLALRPDAS